MNSQKNKSKVKVDTSLFDSFLGEIGSDIEIDEGSPRAKKYASEGKLVIQKALMDFRKETSVGPKSCFGIFLELLRRKENLTRDELAEKANVDISDIKKLEIDSDSDISPRTLFQLEKFFKLKENTLAKLSGAIIPIDNDTQSSITKYAARAKHASHLNDEELQILNEMIALLDKSESS